MLAHLTSNDVKYNVAQGYTVSTKTVMSIIKCVTCLEKDWLMNRVTEPVLILPEPHDCIISVTVFITQEL